MSPTACELCAQGYSTIATVTQHVRDAGAALLDCTPFHLHQVYILLCWMELQGPDAGGRFPGQA